MTTTTISSDGGTDEALSPMGDTVPNNERQARPLAKLEPEAQRQAWTRAVVEVVSAVADIPAPRSERQAYRLIEAASVVEVVSPIGDTLPATESQARPLAKLEPEEDHR